MSRMGPEAGSWTPGSRPVFEEPRPAKAAHAANHIFDAGKDALGYVMKAEYSLNLPLELQVEFAQALQVHVGSTAGRIDVGQIGDIFDREYMIRKRTTALLLQCAASRSFLWWASAGFQLRRSQFNRRPHRDPAVFCAERLAAMGVEVDILSRYSHWVRTSRRFAVYVQCMVGSPVWGVGIADDAVNASLRAVLSAVGRSRQITERRSSS